MKEEQNLKLFLLSYKVARDLFLLLQQMSLKLFSANRSHGLCLLHQPWWRGTPALHVLNGSMPWAGRVQPMCLVQRHFLSQPFSGQLSHRLPVNSANEKTPRKLEPKMKQHWKDPSPVISTYLLKMPYNFWFQRSVQSSETEGGLLPHVGQRWLQHRPGLSSSRQPGVPPSHSIPPPPPQETTALAFNICVLYIMGWKA